MKKINIFSKVLFTIGLTTLAWLIAWLITIPTPFVILTGFTGLIIVLIIVLFF